MRECARCGLPVTKKPGPGRYPKFCSEKCRTPFKWAREHGDFMPRRRGSNQAVCENCGGSCRTGNAHGPTRFCSKKDCRRAAARVRSRDCAVPKKHGTCVECAAPFVGNAKRIYCSTPCLSRAYGRRRREDGRKAEMSAKRRARERGAKVKDGKRRAVLERDDWVCHLCGDRTNPDAVYPAPDYPVIDHVVPLSKGGVHGPENWRTAHNSCNSRRRDISVDEYRIRFVLAPSLSVPRAAFASVDVESIAAEMEAFSSLLERCGSPDLS